jgi:hypothetical protein
MTSDEKLRREEESYFTIHPVDDQTKLKITGTADQRFITD